MGSENIFAILHRVLGVLAFCLKPIILLFWGVVALLRLLTWPLRIPWYLATGSLKVTIVLVVDYEPFVIYLTCAVITGMLCGALAGLLTPLFATRLPLVFPFLRRRRGSQQQQQQQQQQPPKHRNRNHHGPAAVAAKPRPRHVASALTWSSDEDESDPGPVVAPPTLFHKGLTPEAKAKAAARSSIWSRGGPGSGSRHGGSRAQQQQHQQQQQQQQLAKVRVRVGDTIHEESSLSEDQGVGVGVGAGAGGLKGER